MPRISVEAMILWVTDENHVQMTNTNTPGTRAICGAQKQSVRPAADAPGHGWCSHLDPSASDTKVDSATRFKKAAMSS